jgi:hypothetical protein
VKTVRRFPLLRGGKLHCLTSTYSNTGRHTTKIRSLTNFSSVPGVASRDRGTFRHGAGPATVAARAETSGSGQLL